MNAKYTPDMDIQAILLRYSQLIDQWEADDSEKPIEKDIQDFEHINQATESAIRFRIIREDQGRNERSN